MDFCPSLFLTIFFRAPLTIKLPSIYVHRIIFLLPPIFLQVLLLFSPFFTSSFFLGFLLHFRMDQWLLNFGFRFCFMGFGSGFVQIPVFIFVQDIKICSYLLTCWVFQSNKQKRKKIWYFNFSSGWSYQLCLMPHKCPC